jgi:hypothetical protein
MSHALNAARSFQHLRPQPQRTISTSTNTPRLSRMPVQIQHTKLLHNLVTPKHLKRHNSGILHTIAHNLAMEDLHRAVITSVREQRQRRVELGAADGLFVVA